jgi:hypothetical protein
MSDKDICEHCEFCLFDDATNQYICEALVCDRGIEDD